MKSRKIIVIKPVIEIPDMNRKSTVYMDIENIQLNGTWENINLAAEKLNLGNSNMTVGSNLTIKHFGDKL